VILAEDNHTAGSTLVGAGGIFLVGFSEHTFKNKPYIKSRFRFPAGNGILFAQQQGNL